MVLMDGLFITTLIAIHGILALGLGVMSNGDLVKAKSLRLFQTYFLLVALSWSFIYAKWPMLEDDTYRLFGYLAFFLSYEFLLTATGIHAVQKLKTRSYLFIPVLIIAYVLLFGSSKQDTLHITDAYQSLALMFCWNLCRTKYNKGGSVGDLYMSHFFLFGVIAYLGRSIYIEVFQEPCYGLLYSAAVFTLVNIGVCLSLMASYFLEVKASLEKEANTDSLTGIYNRRYFKTIVQQVHASCVRRKSPFSILICDIDHFKKINDTYGHTAGDIALQQVANVLSINKRMEDTLARYGGEEFIFVLPDTTLQEAELLAERIRSTVGTKNIVADSKSFSLTMSFGIAQFDYNDPCDVVDNADAALLHAKSEGRNMICVSEHGVLRASQLQRKE